MNYHIKETTDLGFMNDTKETKCYNSSKNLKFIIENDE